MARRRMRAWLLALLVATVALAGCADDDDSTGDEETTTQTTTTETETPLPEQLEFSFGPSLGCTGDVVPAGPACVSFLAGPGTPAVDGYWIELGELYWGLSFTSTIDSALGDSDCAFVADDGATVLGDASQGSSPCSGKVPMDAAYLFLYPYAEPATAMSLTFTA